MRRASILGLMVLVTAGPAAAAAPTVVVDRDVGVSYGGAAIAVGPGGLPLLAYQDLRPHDLRIASCRDRRCARSRKRVAVTRGNVGDEVAIVFRRSGRPLVAYRDGFGISYLDCADRTCSRGRSRTPDRDGVRAEFGGQFAMILDRFDRPFLVASQGDDDEDERLYLGRCRDGGCSRIARRLGPATSANVTKGLVVGPNGFPAIAHEMLEYRTGERSVELVLCQDPACSRVRTRQVAAGAAETPTLVLAGGLLSVLYHDGTGDDLEQARCTDAACTAFERRTLDGEGRPRAGREPVAALDHAGRPVVSSYDASSGRMEVLRCADAACTTSSVTPIERLPGTSDVSNLAIGPGDVALVAFRGEGNLLLLASVPPG